MKADRATWRPKNSQGARRGVSEAAEGAHAAPRLSRLARPSVPTAANPPTDGSRAARRPSRPSAPPGTMPERELVPFPSPPLPCGRRDRADRPHQPVRAVDIQSLKIDRSARTPRGAPSGGGGSRGPRRRGNPWLGRAVAVLVLAVAAFVLRGPIQSVLDSLNLPRVQLYAVVASRPADAGAVEGTAANGYVVAARRAALSAANAGRIVEMNATEGTRLRKGDIVARLFQDDIRAALAGRTAAIETARAEVVRAEAASARARTVVDQRRSSLEAARADLADLSAQVELQDARFERANELVDRGISSRDDLDAARASVDGARARVRAAEARVLVAEADVADASAQVRLAEAELGTANARIVEAEAARDQTAAQLAETEIRAPFDGIVVLKDAEVGEVVSPNSQGGSNARGSICTMVDFDSLEVQADVPESSLRAVRLGGPVRIYLDAFPDRLYTGRVDRIWPTADRQKATVEVRVRFDERDDFLRPDMGVRIVFAPDGTEISPVSDGGEAPAESGAEALMVPLSAVIRGPDGEDAVLVFERGQVRRATVDLGARDASRVIVTSGLRVGDRVVLDPPTGLDDGDRARPAS
jgi:HlyD family secretion protein